MVFGVFISYGWVVLGCVVSRRTRIRQRRQRQRRRLRKLWLGENMTRVRLFTDDDCLHHDPTYPGIRGWWRDTFGVEFKECWDSAEATELDFGDSFERQITIQERKIFVTFSFDGYHVDEKVEKAQ